MLCFPELTGRPVNFFFLLLQHNSVWYDLQHMVAYVGTISLQILFVFCTWTTTPRLHVSVPTKWLIKVQIKVCFKCNFTYFIYSHSQRWLYLYGPHTLMRMIMPYFCLISLNELWIYSNSHIFEAVLYRAVELSWVLLRGKTLSTVIWMDQ